MTQISENNARRFAKIKAWHGSRAGKAGRDRLIALGVAWPRGSRPDLVVEQLGLAPGAPPLPPLEAFRDKASFIAGTLWVLAFIQARSEINR